MQKEQIETVIAQMPSEFDSHEFIERFMNMYGKEYAAQLGRHAETQTPFRTLHAQIARYLTQHAEELGILPVYRVPSANIKGNETYNQKWEKL